jgi:hypothetical protein
LLKTAVSMQAALGITERVLAPWAFQTDAQPTKKASTEAPAFDIQPLSPPMPPRSVWHEATGELAKDGHGSVAFTVAAAIRFLRKLPNRSS